MSTIIVIGGSGALGKSLVSRLQSFHVINIDLISNPEAKTNLSASQTFKQIREAIGCDQVRAIYAVAGSWEGGNASLENLDESMERLWQSNVKSALLACHLASHLKSALLCLTSAKASLSPCSGMLAYGVCKQAVNQMIKGMAAKDSGLAEGGRVCAILPEIIDTPANRQAMPDADRSSWTPLSTISDYLLSMLDNPPQSGQLIQIVTRNGRTTFT